MTWLLLGVLVAGIGVPFMVAAKTALDAMKRVILRRIASALKLRMWRSQWLVTR